MLKDHAKIRNLLGEIEKTKSKKVFDKFKWNLERHFFIEENAIFRLADTITGQEISDIFELLKQHGEIMNLVEKLEINLSNNAICDFSELKKTLEAHSNFEDGVFYPKLDEILSSDQKQIIKEKITEIINS